MNRRCLRPLTWLIVSAGMGHVLWSAEVSSTVPPSRLRIESLTLLVNEQGPAAGAMSVLRVAMLLASSYVAAVMLMTTFARATRRGSLERFIARLTPRALRPVLGILAVSSVLVAQPTYAQSSDKDPVMVRIDDAPPTAPAGATPPATIPTANTPTTTGPTMRWIGPEEPATDAPPGDARGPDSHPSMASDQRFATWTVQRGDHFWHIAQATLLGRLDRLPTDQETHSYWIAVIAANHERLRDPGNANLIYAGQQFVLPED